MLTIGSQAIPHLLKRKPKDYDFIMWPWEYEPFLSNLDVVHTKYRPKFNTYIVFAKGHPPIECEVAIPDSSGEDLLNLTTVATAEVIYTLKMSHRFLRNSPHFRKTMNDIIRLRSLGYSVPESFKGFMKKREKETYDYAHPKLNQSKSEFFTDNIKYTYDHDSIHNAVKIGSVPAYELMRTGEVMCSKEKFFEMTFEQQISSVLEESYVLALERHQIPNNFIHAPQQSFMIALEKVCTSITSGWWREFAWNHYYDAIIRYSDEYVTKFQQGLKDKTIKEIR